MLALEWVKNANDVRVGLHLSGWKIWKDEWGCCYFWKCRILMIVGGEYRECGQVGTSVGGEYRECD